MLLYIFFLRRVMYWDASGRRSRFYVEISSQIL